MAMANRGEGLGGGSRGMTLGSGRAASAKKGSSKKAVKTAIKNAKKAKPLAEPKSAVKVLPRKTAPKSGLEGRGAKLTPAQQRERARDLNWDRSEREYERSIENQYQGYYTGKDNNFFTSKPGKANIKKTQIIKNAAEKKLPIKINSAPKKKK